MRENLSLSLAAIVIVMSFGIVILFVSVEVIEDKTSTEIEFQEIPNLIGNANEIVTDTRNATKYEIINFINNTSNALQNNTEIQKFQQLWEKP